MWVTFDNRKLISLRPEVDLISLESPSIFEMGVQSTFFVFLPPKHYIHVFDFRSKKIVYLRFELRSRGAITRKIRIPVVVIFVAEKCLKEFRDTCWIWFANALLVKSKTSNMYRTCSFDQLKWRQNYNLTHEYWLLFEIAFLFAETNSYVSNCIFDAFYLVRVTTFGEYSKYYSALKVHLRSKSNTRLWTPSNTFCSKK